MTRFFLYYLSVNRLARVIAAIALLLPLSAAAMQSTSWDFRRDPGEWKVTDGLHTQLTGEGLHVVAVTEGSVFSAVQLDGNPDMVRIVATTPIDTEMKFLWEDKAGGGAVELPFVLRAEGPTEMDLTKYDQWNPKTTSIGLALPPGADITIQQIELQDLNMVEKLEEAFLSTWQFDTFRAYSINFLWGPLVVTTPVGRAQLYAFLPPFGMSVNDVFYVIIGIAGLLVIVAWMRNLDAWRQKKYLSALLCVTAGCYLLYDLRMSAEILTYAKDDLTEYTFADTSEKTFRNMQDFWTIADNVKPFAENTNTVVFVGDGSYVPFLRYALYPVHVVSKDAPRPPYVLWVTYGVDAAVSADGRLTIDGIPVSTSGAILNSTSPNGLIFRELP